MQNVVVMMLRQRKQLPLQKNNIVLLCVIYAQKNKTSCREECIFAASFLWGNIYSSIIGKTLMDTIDWLIIGLGNPGEKYARTRHNIGWMVADALREQYAPSQAWAKGKGAWMQVSARIAKCNVVIALPTTYMNASGEAVERLRVLYRVPHDLILAIVDEYNFPTGKIHVKQGGSGGGHNGIGSMIEELRTDQFWRLRCGIDKKFSAGGMADYVLGEFPEDEQEQVRSMIRKSILALDLICRKGAAQAMSLVNSAKFGEVPTTSVTQGTAKKEQDSANSAPTIVVHDHVQA